MNQVVLDNQVISLVATTTDGWSGFLPVGQQPPPTARWVLQTTGRMACHLSAAWFSGTEHGKMSSLF
jgi:hypothetical protein